MIMHDKCRQFKCTRMKDDLNGFAGAFVTKPFRVVQSREELIDILYHVKQSDERIL